MGIRLDNDPWIDGNVLTALDQSDTIRFSITANSLNSIRTNYQIIKQVGSFDNGETQVVDRFTDADGINNTVNTVDTTAVFDTDHYECQGGPGSYSNSILKMDANTAPITDDTLGFIYKSIGDPIFGFNIIGSELTFNTGITAASTESTTVDNGTYPKMLKDCIINSVTKHASCTATQAHITGNGVNETATFSGNTATFANDVLLEKDKNYAVFVNSGGSSYTSVRNTTFDFPASGVNLEVKVGWFSGGTSANWYENIASIKSQEVEQVDESTKKVKLWDGTATSDLIDDITNSGFVSDATAGFAVGTGIRIEAKEDLIITKVEIDSTCTGDLCNITDNSDNIKTSAIIIGNIATFSSPYFLKSGDTINIVIKKQDNSVYDRSADTTTGGSHTYSFPITGTFLDITHGVSSDGSSTTLTEFYNIKVITTQSATPNETAEYTLDSKGESVFISKESLTNIDNIIITEILETTNVHGSPTTEGYGLEVIEL